MNYLEWAKTHYGYFRKLGCKNVSTGGGFETIDDGEIKLAYDVLEVTRLTEAMFVQIICHAKKPRPDGLKVDKIEHKNFIDGTSFIRINYK